MSSLCYLRKPRIGSRVHTGGDRWNSDKIKGPVCWKKQKNFVPIHLYGHLRMVNVNINTTY